MKKYTANILTFSRVVIGFFLFGFKEYNVTYLIIFLYCGISDALDGFFARKFGSVSQMGSTLDTLGDLIVYFGMAKILLSNEKYHFQSWIYFWFAGTLVIFAVAAFIGLGRFKKVYFVHTISGKLLGILVFTVPFGCYFDLQNAIGIAICVAATTNAIESLIVQGLAPSAESDVKFAWEVKKLREQARSEKTEESA
jgi:CDP-diacylglycerol--glycerol-3-phosphate 3-phosphatidyltransferase